MTIQCRHCKCAIKSVGPPSDFEEAQVLELMARHLVAKHRDKAALLQEEVGLVSTYLMISRHVTVPPAETVLMKLFEESAEAVMRLFANDAKPVA